MWIIALAIALAATAALATKASLVNGKVPLSQLPSVFTPTIVEVPTFQDLPNPGDPSVTYYVQDTQKSYRWLSGANTYVEITQSQNYTAVTVDPGVTLSTLSDIVNAINTNGEHVFFDMHYYLTNGYVCTIFLTQSTIEINDVIGGSYYIPSTTPLDWTQTLTTFLTTNSTQVQYKHSSPQIVYH